MYLQFYIQMNIITKLCIAGRLTVNMIDKSYTRNCLAAGNYLQCCKKSDMNHSILTRRL